MLHFGVRLSCPASPFSQAPTTSGACNGDDKHGRKFSYGSNPERDRQGTPHAPPPGIGDEDSTPKIIDHFVRGFLDQNAATPASHLHNVLVQNFHLVVNECSVVKVYWLQAALAAKRRDIADALYASGIYCDGDGVYFRGSQSFSARPADASLDNGSSLWKAISSEFLLAADYLAMRGERSFAPRMWEQYAATGTNAMWHLISAYQRTEEMIKFRFEGGANGCQCRAATRRSWPSWNAAADSFTALLSAAKTSFTPSPAIGLEMQCDNSQGATVN